MTDAGDLREVRLIGFPLALHARGTEHHEELMREFQLLAINPPTSSPGHQVPQRLIDLIGELTQDYAGFTDAADNERDAARARGEETIDLVYHVPAVATEAVDRLDRMLDEADDFCRAGERLLTLATPPDCAAFRRWYLSEFRLQLGGAEATPWPVYAAAHPEAFAPVQARV